MATKSKTSSKKRTKTKDIPKSKREITGKDMRKVKGGSELRDPVLGLNYSKIER